MDLSKFRPMLAAKLEDSDFGDLTYPMYASAKIDGIRCICHPVLGPVTRTLKPIPNRFIRDYLSDPRFKWMDGEIIVNNPTANDAFNITQSAVMSFDGEPDFRYLVFDYFEAGHRCTYSTRNEDVLAAINLAYSCVQDDYTRRVQHHMQCVIENAQDLAEFEEKCVSEGWEGIIVRSPMSYYKFGRSTLKQQGMLKVKRVEDFEAFVVGFEPLLINDNDAYQDNLGLQKRGYSKDGKIVDDTRIGKFKVVGLNGRWKDVEFKVGSGLTDDERRKYRRNIDRLLGKSISVKYIPAGSLEKPRAPIFKGFRTQIDFD